MSNNIPNLIEALREAIGRSDNNKANETTLALFEAISGQFVATAEADAAIIDQIARAPERKAILVETPAPEAATPSAAALSGPETTTPSRDPLDHDNDGKKGGSVAKKKTTTAKETK